MEVYRETGARQANLGTPSIRCRIMGRMQVHPTVPLTRLATPRGIFALMVVPCLLREVISIADRGIYGNRMHP